MSSAPHRIRRLVLEVTLPEQAAAWSLQSDLARLHSQALEAIVDRCLTAAAEPGRLVRIESLEVDLGALRPEYLEQDLCEQLELRLRQALAAQLAPQSEHGIQSDTAARLELIAFFAQTGNLPWWADAAQSRLVDQTLGLLLQHDAGSLAALLQVLAPTPAALRRLVNHCGEARLSALFEVAVAPWAPRLVGRSTEVAQLARIGGATLAVTAAGWRRELWSAVLYAASGSDRAGAEPEDFWRGVLARAALDLGCTYSSVVPALWAALLPARTRTDAAAPPPRLDSLGAVLWTLLAEVRGEAVPWAAGGTMPAAPHVDAIPDASQAAAAAQDSSPAGAVRRIMSPLDPAAQPGEAFAADVATQEGLAQSDPWHAAELRQGLRLVMEVLHELAAVTASPALSGPAAEAYWQRVWRPLRSLQSLAPEVLAQTLGAWRAALLGSLPAQAPDAEGRGASELPPNRVSTAIAAADSSSAGSRSETVNPPIAAADSSSAGSRSETVNPPASDSGEPGPPGAAALRQGWRRALEALGELSQAAAASTLSEPVTASLWQRFLAPLRALQSLAPDLLARTGQALRATHPGPSRAAARNTAPQASAAPELDGAAPGARAEPTAVGTCPGGALPTGDDAADISAPALPRAPAPTVRRDGGELRAPAPPSRPAQAPSAAGAATPPTRRAELPEARVQPPRINLAYSDTEEAYVENAGLVILWPFLGHLFARLELVADGQFKDLAALHRAVGLLGFLATEDPSPPEYQLTLPKVLCGMAANELLNFGPPVTEAEAEECTGMLTAVIANASILREMSIEGFRGTFLLRKGVLSAQGETWLLRVERVSYDVVLDRFPWGLSWVKQPWMEAALCVEW